MLQLATHLRYLVLTLLFVVIAGGFLIGDTNTAQGRFINSCTWLGQNASCAKGNIWPVGGTCYAGTADSPSGQQGKFCVCDIPTDYGCSGWSIQEYPTWPHTWPHGSDFGAVDNCSALGSYNPWPYNDAGWTNDVGNQTFTFEFNKPRPAVDQSGWFCINPTADCQCTAPAGGQFGSYDQKCSPLTIHIQEQVCRDTGSVGETDSGTGTDFDNATFPGPDGNTPSGTVSSTTFNETKICDQWTTPTATDPSFCATWHWEWIQCDQATPPPACNTPKGMSEDDPPVCWMSYNPTVGQWTNTTVNAWTTGADVAPGPRQSGIAGGIGGGCPNCSVNGAVPAGSAIDNAGNVSAPCGGYISWIDTTDPTMVIIPPAPFAANNPWTPPSPIFADTCGTSGEGPCAGTSGVGAITGTLTHQGNPSNVINISGNGGGAITYLDLNMSGDYSEAGLYRLDIEVCDMAVNQSGPANCFDYHIDNWIHVVANVPEWDSCTQNYRNVCPSSIDYGASSAKYATSYKTGNNADGSKLVIADNAPNEYHAVEVQLSDRYGNPVVSEAGIKTVSINLDYINTVHADQIADTGDAIHFTTDYGSASGVDEDYPAWSYEPIQRTFFATILLAHSPIYSNLWLSVLE